MDTLPDEILLHILAHLSPKTLSSCQPVCKRWNRLIEDDSCWRQAFMHQWNRVPYKRLARDWRGEYGLRLRLLRTWSSNKCANVLFEPRIGTITDIDVNFSQQQLFAATLDTGTLSVCDPSTGRVSRDSVFLSPNVPPQAAPISAIFMSNNRAVVGSVDGFVSIASKLKDGGSGCIVTHMDGTIHHEGPVTCVEPIAVRDGSDKFILSAGRDGKILIWNVSIEKCVRTLHGSGSIKYLLTDTKNGHVLAITESNKLHIWAWLDMSKSVDASKPQPVTRSITLKEQVSCKPLYDPYTSLLIIGQGAAVHFVDIHNGSTFTHLSHSVESSNITCLAWENDSILIENKATSSFREQRLCVLALGCENGNVTVWDCRSIMESFSTTFQSKSRPETHETQYHTKPNVILHGNTAKVTHLHVDAFKITSGSQDGLMRVWDILTTKCLQVLSSQHFRYHHQDSRNRVALAVEPIESHSIRCLKVTSHHIVIAVANQIKTWDFDPNNKLESYKTGRKRKKAGSRRKNYMPFGSPKSQMQFEAKKDVRESNRILEEERKHRNQANYRRDLDLGLTEEEMIQYARMISLDNALPTSSSRTHFDDGPVVSGIPFVEHIHRASSLAAAAIISEDAFPALLPGSQNSAGAPIPSSRKGKAPATVSITTVTVTSPTRESPLIAASPNIFGRQSESSGSSSTPSVEQESKTPLYPIPAKASRKASSSSRPGFTSPPRARKMSLSEFMTSPIAVSGSQSSTSAFPAYLSTSFSPTMAPQSPSPSIPVVGSFDLGPPALAQAQREQSYITDSDDGRDDDRDMYFTNLRDPRGLGSAGGGGFGSSHSGYNRHNKGTANNRTNQWSSVQVVPNPANQAAKEEDDDLQYVLELSMFEK